jgi:1-acyl-sn-glycerol-3-phosphate acyltransferase
MRTLVTVLTLLVMTLILGPVVLVAGLLGVQERPGGIYQRCMHLWARAACRAAGARVIVHDDAHVDQQSGAVYIANHVSWFDIFALAAVLPRYSFVAKSELRKIPLFGVAAQAAGIVFLERENRKAAFESYKGASEQVKQGRSIVVCPEGTRGYEYALRSFKKGPFVLAIASGAPIVPTVVYGAREVMRKGSLGVTAGEIHLHFLPPVPTAGLTYDDRGALMTQVWNRMADLLRDRYGVVSAGQPIGNSIERVS